MISFLIVCLWCSSSLLLSTWPLCLVFVGFDAHLTRLYSVVRHVKWMPLCAVYSVDCASESCVLGDRWVLLLMCLCPGSGKQYHRSVWRRSPGCLFCESFTLKQNFLTYPCCDLGLYISLNKQASFSCCKLKLGANLWSTRCLFSSAETD